MHNRNFLHNFFPRDHIFLHLLNVQYTEHCASKLQILFFDRSLYGRKLATILILPVPSAHLSDAECSSEDENDETDDTECLLSHDDSETDSEEILSDSESSDGDEVINIQPTDSNSIANKEIAWFDSKQSDWVIPDDSNITEKKLKLTNVIALTNDSQPTDFFNLHFTPELYELIFEQTNTYKTSKELNKSIKSKIKTVSIQDIKRILGIVLYMGIVKLPNCTMYWQDQTRIDLIADAMSVNRFGDIVILLHFNDNNLISSGNDNGYNKCYKIQPIINHLRGKFASIVESEKFLSVDEQIVQFKVKSSMKRYLPKKPKKWGYKLRAMAGVSGYIYNFEVEGEKRKTGLPQGCTAPDSVGASGAVVLRMSMNLKE